VFDDVLGFNGALDLSREPLPHFQATIVTEGFDVVEYVWSDSAGFSFLILAFWVEDSTHILRGMNFSWAASNQFNLHTTLRPILRDLGAPSQLLTELSPTGMWGSQIFNMAAIYEEEGISFFLYGGLWPDETQHADYCLDDPLNVGGVTITDPLENGFHDLSPLQEDLIGFIRDMPHFSSSEDVLGLTAGEVTALAMQEREDCIRIDLGGVEPGGGPQSTTVEPSAAPVFSPPPLPSSVESDFLFGGNSPECPLPCWNGLIVGESGREEIQAVFDDVFGFNGAYDLFAEPPPPYYSSPTYDLDGLRVVGYEWARGGVDSLRLAIHLWVEEDTSTLREIAFQWGGDVRLGSQVTLRRILREMGTPSHLVMLLGPPQAYYAAYEVAAIYEEEGVVFWLSGGMPAVRPDDEDALNVEVCLEERFDSGRVHIVEPPPEDSSNFRRFWLSNIPRARYLDPSEDVLGLTAEELTALAMQDEDVCMTIEFEGY